MGRPAYKLVGPMGKGATVRDGFITTLDLGEGRYVVVSERMRGPKRFCRFHRRRASIT